MPTMLTFAAILARVNSLAILLEQEISTLVATETRFQAKQVCSPSNLASKSR